LTERSLFSENTVVSYVQFRRCMRAFIRARFMSCEMTVGWRQSVAVYIVLLTVNHWETLIW